MENVIELLKALEELEGEVFFRILSLFGTALVFLWSTFFGIYKYNKNKKEKKEERQHAIEILHAEQENEIKKKGETEREAYILRLGQLQNRWDRHDNQQSKDRHDIKTIMDSYISKEWGANLVHFCECKNGGDHIIASKDYTISIKLESINYSKNIKSEINNWQSVIVRGQFHDYLFTALTEGYSYIQDYENNLEDGDLKDSIKKKNGTNIASFYIGRIERRHFYLLFQFGEFDAKSKGDLLQIRNQCNTIYAMMRKSYSYKEQTELLQEVTNRMRNKLLDKGLITPEFIKNYETYINQEIEDIKKKNGNAE